MEGTELNKNKSQPTTNGNILLLMWLEALHLNMEGVQHRARTQCLQEEDFTEKAVLAFYVLGLQFYHFQFEENVHAVHAVTFINGLMHCYVPSLLPASHYLQVAGSITSK